MNTMYFSYYLRTERTNKRGATIMALLTVNGKSLKFSTSQKCLEKDWDASKSRTKKNSAQNAHLDLLQSKFNTLFYKSEHDGVVLTCEQARDYILGKVPKVERLPTLPEAWIAYLAYKEEFAKAQGLELSNKRDLEIKQRAVQKILSNLGLADLQVSEYKLKHAYQMHDYMLFTEKRKGENPVRIVRDCKSVFKFCRRQGWIEQNPFLEFSAQPHAKTELCFLTEEELQAIKNASFSDTKTEQAKDLFLILCYTGLLYKDLMNLKETNLVTHNDRVFLKGQRGKGVARGFGKFEIPLHETAKEVFEKYGGIENLPRLIRSKVNKSLLEVSEKAGTQYLSTKLGRKTFAHHALNTWFIPLETVAKMLGHSTTQTTLKYYAKIGINKVDNDTKGKM